MMAAKIGIWLVWVFAVLVGMLASFVGAVLAIPILAMVVFSPALFMVVRRAPWAAQSIAALILGAYAAWTIVDQIL